MANPEFKTETSWTYEIGGSKEIFKDTIFRTAVFYSDISDYQQHSYSANLVYNKDVVLYGLELELVRNFKCDVSGYISYTAQDWDVEDHPLDDENTSYFMQAQPKQRAVLGLNYKMWEGGLVNMNVKYYDKRLSQSEDVMREVVVMNAGVEHTFKLPHDCAFTIKGYVNNITDQDYQLHYGYDMPGCTAGISGTLAF